MAARASSVVALALCATAAPAQSRGPLLYVSNEIANTISVIAPASGSVVRTIAVGKRPRGMALSPDGHTVYVALGQDDAIGVIDVARAAVTGTVPAGRGPPPLVVGPAGPPPVLSNEGVAPPPAAA